LSLCVYEDLRWHTPFTCIIYFRYIKQPLPIGWPRIRSSWSVVSWSDPRKRWCNAFQLISGQVSGSEFDRDQVISDLIRVGATGPQWCEILLLCLCRVRRFASSWMSRTCSTRVSWNAWTLLANGEVPGLFEGDEMTTLMTQCKEGAQREGLAGGTLQVVHTAGGLETVQINEYGWLWWWWLVLSLSSYRSKNSLYNKNQQPGGKTVLYHLYLIFNFFNFNNIPLQRYSIILLKYIKKVPLYSLI
jgi:hypothetical protein